MTAVATRRPAARLARLLLASTALAAVALPAVLAPATAVAQTLGGRGGDGSGLSNAGGGGGANGTGGLAGGGGSGGTGGVNGGSGAGTLGGAGGKNGGIVSGPTAAQGGGQGSGGGGGAVSVLGLRGGGGGGGGGFAFTSSAASFILTGGGGYTGGAGGNGASGKLDITSNAAQSAQGGGGGGGGAGIIFFSSATGQDRSGRIVIDPGIALTGGAGGNGGNGSAQGIDANALGGSGGSGGSGLQTLGNVSSVEIAGRVTGGRGGAAGTSTPGAPGTGLSGGDGGAGIWVTLNGVPVNITLTSGASIAGGDGGAGGSGSAGKGGSGIKGAGISIYLGQGQVAGGVGADGRRGHAIEFTGGENRLSLDDGTAGLTGDISLTGSLDLVGSDATLAAAIVGGGSVSKKFNGTVTLSGANTYTGATTVEGGTLKGGATNTFSATSAATIGMNGALDLGGYDQEIGSLAGTGTVTNSGTSAATLTAGGNNTDTTFAGVIQDGATGGTTALRKVGTGTLTLTTANTYTGDTTLAGGTLALTGSGALGSGALRFEGMTTRNSSTGVVTFTGGTLLLGGSEPVAFSNAIALGGTSLANSDVYAGHTVRTASGSGNVTLSGPISDTSACGPVGQPVCGRLVVDNTANTQGTVTLSGENSFAGGLTVRRGTLAVTRADALGTGAAVIIGATLQAAGAGDLTIANALSFRNDLAGGPGSSATGIDTGGSTLTLTGAVSVSSSSITKKGSGTLVLGNSGNTINRMTVEAGTLRLAADGAYNSATAIPYLTLQGTSVFDLAGYDQRIADLRSAAGTTVRLGSRSLAGGVTKASTLTFSDNTFVSATIEGAGGLVVDVPSSVQFPEITLGATNTYSGGTRVKQGMLFAGADDAFGTGGLTLDAGTGAVASVDNHDVTVAGLDGGGPDGSGGGRGAVGVADGGVLRVDVAQDAVSTFDGQLVGVGTFEKKGAGRQILTGTNSIFDGATRVSAGTLQVDGSLANSALSVESGGTLAGGGRFGDVTVKAGGTLAPSAGLAAAAAPAFASLTLQDGSSTVLRLDAPSATGGAPNDLVTVTGALSLGGSLQLRAGTGGPSPNGTYRLFTAGATDGAFASVLDNAGTDIGYRATVTRAADHVDVTLAQADQQVQTWTGGTGSWNATASNWQGSDGTAQQWRGGVAVFGGTGAIVTASGVSAEGLRFTADGYTIAGALTLSGNAAALWTNQTTFDTQANVTATVSATLSGADASKGLVKRGAGTLVLTGANTYAGGTWIEEGRLAIGNDRALGTGTVTIEGGTLATGRGGATSLENAVRLAGDARIEVGSRTANLTLYGAISDKDESLRGRLVKTGEGRLTLSHAHNTYSGGTLIEAGRVFAEAGGALGTGGGGLRQRRRRMARSGRCCADRHVSQRRRRRRWIRFGHHRAGRLGCRPDRRQRRIRHLRLRGQAWGHGPPGQVRRGHARPDGGQRLRGRHDARGRHARRWRRHGAGPRRAQLRGR